jgi:hypothetical protein
VFGPGSNRNEYQESSWGCREASTLGWQPYRHLWADCLEMWEPGRLTTLSASTACYRDSFAFYHIKCNTINVTIPSEFHLLNTTSNNANTVRLITWTYNRPTSLDPCHFVRFKGFTDVKTYIGAFWVMISFWNIFLYTPKLLKVHSSKIWHTKPCDDKKRHNSNGFM